MNTIKRFLKALEGIFILLIPVILFYWLLIILNLPALKPFVAIFDYIFNSPLNLIRLYMNLSIKNNNLTIDFAPIILAIICFGFSIVMMNLVKVVNLIEKSIKNIQNISAEIKIKNDIELERLKYLEYLKNHDNIYLILKLITKNNEDSYLFKQEEDFFSKGIVNNLINGVIDAAVNFYNAQKHSKFNEKNETYNFIFPSTKDAVDYIIYLQNRMIEINREVLDQSTNVSYSVVCHCGCGEDNDIGNLKLSYKILGLVGEKQILVSDIFKNRYVELEAQDKIIFNPKGIYNLGDNEIEIFELKV